MTYEAARSYKLEDVDSLNHSGDTDDPVEHNVHEFDYRVCNGVVFERDDEDHGHIKITSFPALHIIDGAVSYRVEWTPRGKEQAIVFVYSGDTLPNEFMLEYGKNADLLIHETAPSVSSVVNGANVSPALAEDIVNNSHTPAEFLGYIFSLTKPKLGVTTHTPMDPRSVDAMITDVRKNWPHAYQIGADFMVFNANGESSPTTRMGVPVNRAWPVRIEEVDERLPPPLSNPADIDYLRQATASNLRPGEYIEDMSEDGISPSLSRVIFDHQINDVPSESKCKPKTTG